MTHLVQLVPVRPDALLQLRRQYPVPVWDCSVRSQRRNCGIEAPGVWDEYINARTARLPRQIAALRSNLTDCSRGSCVYCCGSLYVLPGRPAEGLGLEVKLQRRPQGHEQSHHHPAQARRHAEQRPPVGVAVDELGNQRTETTNRANKKTSNNQSQQLHKEHITAGKDSQRRW